MPEPQPSKQDLKALAKAQEPITTAYYEAKYPQPIREACVYQPREGLASYLGRIYETFPSTQQQTYLKGLSMAITIGEMGLSTIASYYQRTAIHPVLQTYFPPEDNLRLAGQDTDSPAFRWGQVRVVLDHDKTNEAIVAFNDAALVLEKFGESELAKTRDTLKQIASRRGKIKGSLKSRFLIKKAQLKLATLKPLLGDNFDDMLEQETNELITLDGLNISTPSSAEAFRLLAALIGEPYNPFEAHVQSVRASLALDDLNIFPKVAGGLRAAVEENYATPQSP